MNKLSLAKNFYILHIAERVFGGYNNFAKGVSLKREWFDMPPHMDMKISFKIYFLDEWLGEKLTIRTSTGK